MTTPQHQAKAEFFKTLAHPMRIRVLELLSERDHSVAEMLAGIGVEASHLSQQLAVLLVMARRILTTVLADQMRLLGDPQAETPAPTGPSTGPGRGSPRGRAARTS